MCQVKSDLLQLMPSAEEIQRALASVENIDDFFGKDGVFARLFGDTLTQMMQGELTAQLGYEPYEAKGRNSGNSRNGKYQKTVRTLTGEIEVEVPRDRNGDYEPQILRKYQASSNELEDKIIAMYAKGMTTRDIEDHLRDMYGVEASATTISTITNQVMPLVEEWQNLWGSASSSAAEFPRKTGIITPSIEPITSPRKGSSYVAQ
jgi:putative transposase